MIIPCYNESEVLPLTLMLFKDHLIQLIENEQVSSDSRILLVDDGSSDDTWRIIQSQSKEYSVIKGLSLTRNRGHQNALLAGLMEAKDLCDITISIDADGQDDILAIDEMINAYNQGSDIVYGVRRSRDTDSAFKKFSAQGFYRLMRWLGAEIVYNHADFRLVSSRVLKSFSDFKEVNIFLRGMFPLVGYNSSAVYYDRKERQAGETHYSLAKMLKLAFDGITSLSIKPIRIISILGMIISCLSFIVILWALISYLCGNTVPGWASNMMAIAFLGGIQLLSLGIIGEYVGKIYLEVKHRPRYIIKEKTW